jgi:hypothetical protein
VSNAFRVVAVTALPWKRITSGRLSPTWNGYLGKPRGARALPELVAGLLHSPG